MGSTDFRRLVAVALAGAMAVSCASCMLIGGPNKKEIVEAADTFASALLKQDAGKVVKLTNEKKDSDAAEALDVLWDESMYSDEQNEFNNAVADTITYEVDEESVEVDKEEASVDVVFTLVDYEKALKDDYSDIDEVLDLIGDCDDTKEVTITFEFEKDDDEWLLTNLKDKGFGKLFDYCSYELDIMGDLFDMFSYSDTVAGDWYVDSWFYFEDDITDYSGLIFYDVYYNGSVILSAQTAYVYESYFYCTYEDPDYNDLPAGDYYFSVECNGTVTTSDTVTIEESTVPTSTGSGSSGIDYNFDVDGLGELADYVVAVDWWGDDGNYSYSDTPAIEYDVYFTSDITYDQVMGITFNVYDEDGNLLAEGESIASNRTNIDDSVSEDGYYFIYVGYLPEAGNVEPGVYYIEVCNPDGSTLLYDYCYVY
jgi:hypothetical protein